MIKNMKKLILIAFIGSILLNCSKDDVECKCDLRVTIDGNSYYTVTGVPTDCNGNYERPSNVPPEHFIVGLVNCE